MTSPENLLLYIPNRASARDGDGGQQVIRCRGSYDCSSQHLVRGNEQCNNVYYKKDEEVMDHAVWPGAVHMISCCI